MKISGNSDQNSFFAVGYQFSDSLLVHQPVNKVHHEANGYSFSKWCNAEVEHHRSARGLICKRLCLCYTSCEGNTIPCKVRLAIDVYKPTDADIINGLVY